MADRSSAPAYPPYYPHDGTYADLLAWHLEYWGTREDGNTTVNGQPWSKKDFRLEAFASSEDAQNSARTGLNNWLGFKGAPNDLNHSLIKNALFGDNPVFERWRIDLDNARQQSPDGKNFRTRWFPPPPLVGTLHDLGSGRFDFPIVKDNLKYKQNKIQIAAAARENTALVRSRLAKFFVGRVDDIKTIDQFVSARMAGAPQGLLVVTAPPGFGKSALAAHWCDQVKFFPHRRIVHHFCATSAGEPTTSLENIYTNLHFQLTEIFRDSQNQSNSFDTIVSLLGEAPPGDQELVIWLDGIDEADGKVGCFLPLQLGERICVIVSSRSDDGTIPSYLSPWLVDDMAVSHNPVRLSLDNLTKSDVDCLVRGMFAEKSIIVPHGLVDRIFQASGNGHALFVSKMTESAIDAVKQGQPVDLGEAPESLRGYADRELQRLESLERWPQFQSLFAFLTIAQGAVDIDELPSLISKDITPRSIPSQIMRWLSLTEMPRRNRPALISFSHPLLARIFGEALGYERKAALDNLCRTVMALPYSEWPSYAWRQFPWHLIEAGQEDQARKMMNSAFVKAQFKALAQMKSHDWNLINIASIDVMIDKFHGIDYFDSFKRDIS